MKKIVLGFATLGILLGFSVNGFADTIESSAGSTIEVFELEDGGTMTVEIKDITPEEILEEMRPSYQLIEENPFTQDAHIPTKTKKISGNTTYSYSGSSDGRSGLYSAYKFYGSSGYKVTCRNSGTSKTTLKAKSLLKTYGSTTIEKGKSASITFSGISTDKEWYLAFTGSGYKVSGTVSKN